MTLTVLPYYAAALAVMYVVLAGLVVRQRVKCRVGLGDGQQPALVKAVRIHGNFAEYVPLLLILLLILEIQGAALWQLHLIGGLTLAGRLSHAVGLSKTSGTSAPRMIGMLSTFVALLSSAAFLVLGQV
ncbi:glutathione S-transferase [Rheinheimera sp. SA_1]|uniref:MAPEG family protein n=1 Tax=Rheinheimera sp. SA_1 TaxID=1827365 RepID=UPI0008018A88|nr:MAPEG family protein [Rheinheimera sp. SA_1]OBP15612.1 glutathione S-transferase [Rheinheimera sp. SA_1]